MYLNGVAYQRIVDKVIQEKREITLTNTDTLDAEKYVLECPVREIERYYKLHL